MYPNREVFEYGYDILNSEKYQELDNYMQHGTLTVKDHSINVANKCIEYVNKHNIECDKKSLVVGALLHDFFLYDWHIKGNRLNKMHAFTHPAIALKNAEQYYELNKIEKDMIKKHMWPTTIVLPKEKETWIIVLIDKICAFQETLKIFDKFSVKW